METNTTAALATDSQEMQKVIGQTMSEMLRSLPKPNMPSWVETSVDFVKIHPWVSLFILLGILLIISAIVREIICSYLKINDCLARLKRIEEKLK